MLNLYYTAIFFLKCYWKRNNNNRNGKEKEVGEGKEEEGKFFLLTLETKFRVLDYEDRVEGRAGGLNRESCLFPMVILFEKRKSMKREKKFFFRRSRNKNLEPPFLN